MRVTFFFLFLVVLVSDTYVSDALTMEARRCNSTVGKAAVQDIEKVFDSETDGRQTDWRIKARIESRSS